MLRIIVPVFILKRSRDGYMAYARFKDDIEWNIRFYEIDNDEINNDEIEFDEIEFDEIEFDNSGRQHSNNTYCFCGRCMYS